MKNTLPEINNAVKNNPLEFVNSSEKEYVDEIYSAAQIIADNDDIKIVALAGPSGSGKTTSAHILRDRLEVLGETVITVSLDDFYLPENLLPILPNGKKDIESPASLDTALIKRCLNEIVSTGKTYLPSFDFKSRTSNPFAKMVDIGERGIVIVEGLHALNPIVTDLVPKKNIFKIYVSVNCGINDENGKQILSSRQIRLMRRSLRDEVFRGTDINTTLTLWEDVVAGERKYLYCFKETADFLLKTLHSFEPSIYKEGFSSMLERVDKNHKGYEYFLKTVNAVNMFYPLASQYVPKTSLIREFIGDGKYN
ncbi:MAG: hypothetical protein IKK24_00635 [Clostridia bacterium]|nr:hypothetical protein [Clostridia bacterium]